MCLLLLLLFVVQPWWDFVQKSYRSKTFKWCIYCIIISPLCFAVFYVDCRRWLGRGSEFQRKCRPGAWGLYWGTKNTLIISFVFDFTSLHRALDEIRTFWVIIFRTLERGRTKWKHISDYQDHIREHSVILFAELIY